MSEMIERVANRLMQSCEAWLTISDARVLAGAVINEMREPTEAMVDAPERDRVHSPQFNEDGSVVTSGNITYCWQTMIEAAQR